jgi:hypothetical protein
MTSSPVIVNFMIMSSLTPGVVARGQPARPPIQTKSFASTKMPCSRPGHAAPFAGPPQLLSSFPAASNCSTGGAAFARLSSGIDCGTCSTQMLSLRSTEIDVTSPSTQLFGIVGHAGSTLNCGARRLVGVGAVTQQRKGEHQRRARTRRAAKYRFHGSK